MTYLIRLFHGIHAGRLAFAVEVLDRKFDIYIEKELYAKGVSSDNFSIVSEITHLRFVLAAFDSIQQK